MQKILGPLFRAMPFLFGIGFLAPLLAEVLVALGWGAANGVPPIAIGLGVGGLWGALATRTGRWI